MSKYNLFIYLDCQTIIYLSTWPVKLCMYLSIYLGNMRWGDILHVAPIDIPEEWMMNYLFISKSLIKQCISKSYKRISSTLKSLDRTWWLGPNNQSISYIYKDIIFYKCCIIQNCWIFQDVFLFHKIFFSFVNSF